MRKRILPLILAVVLIFGLSAPAIAADDEVREFSAADVARSPSISLYDNEESYDEELARITAIVKDKLGLDTEEYTDFYGNIQENGPNTRWSLNWSSYADNKTKSLTISVNGDGKVMSYNSYSYNNYENSYYNGKFSPKFNKYLRSEGMAVANDFLAKVLDENEKVVFDDNSKIEPIGTSSFNFWGNLYVDGVRAPISVSVNVDAATLEVTNFSRSDDYNAYIPGYPSAQPAISAEDALAKMADGVSVELQYNYDWETKVASPKYNVRTDSGFSLVDAQTGKIIDMNALYQAMYRTSSDRGTGGMAMNDVAMESAAPMSAKEMLSETERAAIDKLEGVMKQEDIEAAIRAIDVLGLGDDFVCSYISYGQPYGDDNAVDVHLSFAKYWFVETDKGQEYQSIHKSITADAKTGAFKSMWGSESNPIEPVEVELVDGMTYALELFPELADMRVYERSYDIQPYAVDDAADLPLQTEYYYVQYVNDIPFTYNSVSISYSKYDGSLLTLSHSKVDEVTFAPADNLISADEAKAAFLSRATAELMYTALPVEVLPNDVRPLYKSYYDMGYTFVYEMALTYALNTNSVWEIDAVTGEPNELSDYSYEAFTYTDIEQSYAKAQIEKLATYRIGYEGGEFKPEETLTALDFAIFYLSADGYGYYGEKTSEEDIKWIMEAAVNRGLLVKGTDPTHIMTRIEVIANLINATEYGVSANLNGIFTTAFADNDSIPAEFVGHAAIAKAIGLVQGDNSGNLDPNDPISRQDAAIILHNFMSR